jgi:hypothetical protein
MDELRRSVTNHGLTEEDTRDRARGETEFWVKENDCRVEKSLDDDDDETINTCS